MDIIVHHSISDLYKTLNLPAEQEMDFTILSVPEIHSQIPFRSPMLRADYFSFVDFTQKPAGFVQAVKQGLVAKWVSIPWSRQRRFRSKSQPANVNCYVVAVSDDAIPFRFPKSARQKNARNYEFLLGANPATRVGLDAHNNDIIQPSRPLRMVFIKK